LVNILHICKIISVKKKSWQGSPSLLPFIIYEDAKVRESYG
jgi:hypothetical protein